MTGQRPPGGRRLTREARAEALIGVGLKLFGERPLDAVSTREICEAAGISRPLLQHYFGSKRGLFLAVLGRAVERLEQTARPAPGDAPFQTLVPLLTTYFTFVRQHPAGALLASRPGSGMDAEIQAIVQPFRQGTYELVAQALGHDRVDDSVALAVWGWVGLNETTGLHLLERPEISEAKAAQYAALSLFSLIGAALRVRGQPMPADWQRFAEALAEGLPRPP
ncbi:TetR/AcrR family transcriptional regulator [Deinococcus koreensis]|uniref:HTH tetR-type domain-containing protein n=1 Tax=Deinococcus koreensis TaxID=2054903 RepID=A0A2K3UUD7_9DEIO|nr:TetR/AcrR family transcriptional regulator [Deinococcus koreensis]PNY80151.1 hypothetical protein CVO96_01190 [Deinococcus koreensis]